MRLLYVSMLFLLACQPTTPASRYDQVADAYCGCARQLVTLNRQAQALAADTSAQIDFQAMQTEYEKARECAVSVVTRYGKLKPEEVPEVQKSLALKCPALAEQRDLLRELMGE